LLVAAGAVIAVLAGLMWLALYWYGGYATPDPATQRAAWIVLGVGVALAAIPAAIGFRRLRNLDWSDALSCGLLAAAIPILLVLLWTVVSSGR
jgi:cytochrome bd-type quinol oxidase subunit 2